MRILGTVAVCFVGVVLWSVSHAPVRAEPRAAPAAPAADTSTAVYNGWKWWHVYRARCHGTAAIGTTTAPSLIDTNEKMSRAAFVKIVREGVTDKGMAGWDKLLDAKQMGQLYVYVRARADKVLPPGRPDEVGPNKGKWEPADWTPK